METKEKGKKKTYSLKTRALSFDKAERLSTRSDFKSVADRGSSLRLAGVRILFLKKEKSPSRLGIWTSKRDFKKAVTRNLIKRWVREFFRRNKRLMTSWDVVVHVQKIPEKHPHEGLDEILTKLFEKARIIEHE